jgi:MFS superfamily sulfate permease-like transporter
LASPELCLCRWQSIAYGLLAGLPSYYGLYASLIPPMVYAAFGTSRQMHIGPFALVSLLVAEGAGAAVDADVEGIDAVRPAPPFSGARSA